MPALEGTGLVVRFGDVVAVDGLSLVADRGEVLCVLGPNGAGKTTTVETLEGYRRPDAGTVRVLGMDPVGEAARVLPHIGVMLQEGGIYPQLSAREAIALFGAYYDDPVPTDELLDRVGLERVARTPWRRMSGGEQRRLSLALALVGRPAVVFLDEPTAGVDPQGRLAIRAVIRELRDDGVCVLLTTHELGEAERLADRVVIVDRGRAVATGTPGELMRAGGGAEIRFGAPPALDVASLSAHLGGAVVEAAPGEYVAAVGASPANVAALTAWLAQHDLPLADLHAGRTTLEDVFLRLTSGDGAAP